LEVLAIRLSGIAELQAQRMVKRMPIITEAELRERVRQPRIGMKVCLPKGMMFSPSAADFVKQWHIEVTYEDVVEAHPNGDSKDPAAEQPEWEKPSVFPVNLKGELPHCVTCGTPLKKKPEHMTQLNAVTFAPKNNDRIRLRGKMDTLQAVCLLIGANARSGGAHWLAELLDTLAAYIREIMSAEYNERPVAPISIGGLDDTQLRKTTHNPQEALGIPHLTPASDDSTLLLWLNYLRCLVRETEITVIETYGGEVYGKDPFGMVQAVNRLSSAVYYLELLVEKDGKPKVIA
jgi:ethanolamine utilization cobalamin adenosyltransferase